MHVVQKYLYMNMYVCENNSCYMHIIYLYYIYITYMCVIILLYTYIISSASIWNYMSKILRDLPCGLSGGVTSRSDLEKLRETTRFPTWVVESLAHI